MVAKILALLNFASVQACDGVQGVEVLDREGEGVGLVLVDWNMPRMNGLEFLKCIRARPEFNHLPCIMVTTENDINQMVEALSAGANEYLMKPFTPEMLQAKLRILQVKSS